MDIIVTMLDGTSHTLMVNPQDTVWSLKTQIQDKFRVPPEKQKLIFVNGEKTTLEDNSKPVSYYGLQSGSLVHLLVTQPPTIQVELRNEKGKISIYDIAPDETVRNFKAKVEQREGVPVSQQRLLHQSREMREGRLSDYKVKDHSTIDMLFRLRGG